MIAAESASSMSGGSALAVLIIVAILLWAGSRGGKR